MINERLSIEFRMEAANALNHPAFTLADQNSSFTGFGRIIGTFSVRRLLQFAL